MERASFPSRRQQQLLDIAHDETIICLLLAVTGLHDFINKEKLARYYSRANKHLALDHV